MAKTIAQLQAAVDLARKNVEEVSARQPPSPEWMIEELKDVYFNALDALWKAEDYENDPF